MSISCNQICVQRPENWHYFDYRHLWHSQEPPRILRGWRLHAISVPPCFPSSKGCGWMEWGGGDVSTRKGNLCSCCRNYISSVFLFDLRTFNFKIPTFAGTPSSGRHRFNPIKWRTLLCNLLCKTWSQPSNENRAVGSQQIFSLISIFNAHTEFVRGSAREAVKPCDSVILTRFGVSATNNILSTVLFLIEYLWHFSVFLFKRVKAALPWLTCEGLASFLRPVKHYTCPAHSNVKVNFFFLSACVHIYRLYGKVIFSHPTFKSHRHIHYQWSNAHRHTYVRRPVHSMFIHREPYYVFH